MENRNTKPRTLQVDSLNSMLKTLVRDDEHGHNDANGQVPNPKTSTDFEPRNLDRFRTPKPETHTRNPKLDTRNPKTGARSTRHGT